jgi:hypothetical protein
MRKADFQVGSQKLAQIAKQGAEAREIARLQKAEEYNKQWKQSDLPEKEQALVLKELKETVSPYLDNFEPALYKGLSESKIVTEISLQSKKDEETGQTFLSATLFYNKPKKLNEKPAAAGGYANYFTARIDKEGKITQAKDLPEELNELSKVELQKILIEISRVVNDPEIIMVNDTLGIAKTGPERTGTGEKGKEGITLEKILDLRRHNFFRNQPGLVGRISDQLLTNLLSENATDNNQMLDDSGENMLSKNYNAFLFPSGVFLINQEIGNAVYHFKFRNPLSPELKAKAKRRELSLAECYEAIVAAEPDFFNHVYSLKYEKMRGRLKAGSEVKDSNQDFTTEIQRQVNPKGRKRTGDRSDKFELISDEQYQQAQERVFNPWIEKYSQTQ